MIFDLRVGEHIIAAGRFSPTLDVVKAATTADIDDNIASGAGVGGAGRDGS